MDAVRLTGLHKSFGDAAAVDGVDLATSPGEVATLLGPNGAGRTATIDMILGLSHPTSGDARVSGMGPRQTVDRSLVAAIMQTVNLLPDITVRETVQLTANLLSHRIDAEDVIRHTGVTDFTSCIVKKCSGSQQQRLHSTMALVNDPALLILDEPTTGMDVEGRHSFWEAIHADVGRGRTIVFVAHHLEEADAFTNRVVPMRHRRIIADGIAARAHASVSGRSSRATLVCTPGRLHDALTDPQICGQVHDVEILGSLLILSSTGTDTMATLLLSEHLAQDLEITSRGLEDVFITLTNDSASTPSAGASA